MKQPGLECRWVAVLEATKGILVLVAVVSGALYLPVEVIVWYLLRALKRVHA